MTATWRPVEPAPAVPGARPAAALARAGNRTDIAVAVGIMLGALGLRLPMLGEWSLWFDEGTTIAFAYQLDALFAEVAIVYFLPLRAVFDLAGLSVFWGRLPSALAGVASIGLLYGACRLYFPMRAAIIAASFASVCLQHLFWSQSIRYYTLLLAFEIGACWLFLAGVTRERRTLLAAGGLLAAASVFVHSTAMLLLPVWVAFLGLEWSLGRVDIRRVGMAGLLAIAPVAAAIAALLPALGVLQASGANGPPPVFQSPAPLLLRFALYHGVPMAALTCLAAARLRPASSPALWFFACLAMVPVAEVAVLGAAARANVTIHHAFVSLAGMAVLSGVALSDLLQRHRRFGWAVLGLSAVYYGAFVGLYFTEMHGDRPRWKEASQYLRQSEPLELTSSVPIYSTAPDVVKFYLGVPPADIFDSTLVRDVPPLDALTSIREGWFAVDARALAPPVLDWLRAHARPAAQFEARTGPRDRTVTIYRLSR
jgi:hypothetical protein